jgi:hypothetical protein
MKKTALVLVGIASSTAVAAAAPRLADHDVAASPPPADRATLATPTDDFDAWLETSYHPPMNVKAAQFLDAAARTIGGVRRMTRMLVTPAIAKQQPAQTTYPRVDERGDYVCANVATKGGSQRKCRDRSGVSFSMQAWLE